MDNFENQDLGGLPVLKKETPSQKKDLGGLPILKKKEPTPSGFSVTPSPSQNLNTDEYIENKNYAKFGTFEKMRANFGYLPELQTPIASAIKKDTQKDENTAAGIYNTLVGSVKRLAGGVAYMAEVGGLVSGGRPEFAITRLANAENVRQKTEQFVEKARSEKSSKGYEQAMGKYDFTPEPGGGLLSGVDANDFKALAFTAPSQALDMVLGSLTYGSSFVAQSVSDAANELNESDAGKKLNEPQKAIYIFTQAAVQAALEKLSLDLILKNTGLGKIAKRKIANEITDEFVSKGIKATAKDIEEAAFKKASTFANKVKRVGFKAASGVVTEGTTEGTQTAAQEGIKLLTNKIVDKDVFDEEDIIANLGKNIINATIGGGAFGTAAGGGVGVFQNTNKAIRDEVAKAGKKYFVNDTEVSEAEFNAATGNKKAVSDITKIQDEISKQVEEGNITPQEAQAANITAQQYAEIAGKIPTTVSPQDKYRIIGGIEQREALNARKQQAYDELTNLDPVFRKEKQDQIDLIQAKIDETNDYLEGIVSGKKPEYKEKRGMYFKVDSEGNETPINKETYDLAKSIREEDERKAKEPVDTTPAVIMPEENIPPQVIEPSKGPAVIMPEENVPAETTVIRPEQQGKGAAVIMPEANVAPEVAETVINKISKIDRSNQTFPVAEIQKANPNEIDILQQVQNSDVIKQAKIDQDLHDAVQDTDRFSEEDKLFLENDKKLKQRFIDLIEGKNVSEKEINEVVSELEKDKEIHQTYLGMPENENTGSYIWHKHWMSVYDGWISKLNDIKQITQQYPTAKITPAAKPEVKSKLESFKTKFAPQPKEVSISAVSAAQKRVNRQEAAKIAPTDARGFALSWMNQSPDALDWNSIKDLFGGRRARLNVKEVTPEEIAKRDYVAEKEGDEKIGKNGKIKGIDDVVSDIWNNLPEGLEDRITTEEIKNELERLISEYPTRADAAKALIQHEGSLKGKSIEEQQLAFEERKGVEEGEEIAPVEIEGGFVPFVEGEEELPFAVQEATTEEVAAMQDIVKDYIDDGTTSLSEIKKAIAKELGYNTKKLRQTIEDAYTKYTTTEEAAVIEVKSGLLGRIGNAFGKMFGKEAQKPFISKDGKALVAKAKNVAETGGRVSFQATLGNGETVTAKPVDASVVNGFYSPLELQINQMKQDKMPAKQWLDKLRGEEAKWTGLSDWLTQQEGSLTKENIKNWLQDNQIEINEIVKGNKDITNEKDWDFDAIGDGVWKKTLDNGDEVVFDASEGSGTVVVFINSNEIGTVNYDDRSEIFEKVLDQGFIDQYLNLSDGLSSTKYGKYTLEGDKEDYKEILITYPTAPNVGPAVTFEQWNSNRRSRGEKEGTIEEYKKAGILYKSSHFDEKNILVHIRSDIRTDSKGNKIFFIEEVQSDWGQEGKKKGFTELSLNEIKRYDELKSIMPILSDAYRDIHQATGYAYKYDVSTSAEEFYKLSVKERKDKVNETHEKFQKRTNEFIDFLQKEIDKRNKKISDNIDEELLLERGEYKLSKFLETVKNNREYIQASNELEELNQKIKDLNRESVKLEEKNSTDSEMISSLNKDKDFDDFQYGLAINNSDLTFDKKEYDKITIEYNELKDKITQGNIKKAPFVTKTNDWAKLGLKVALKNAVRSGASKIAWTNGEQQNERYDLSKQVSYIEKVKESDINKENNQFQVDISFPSGMINLFVNKDTNKIDYYLGNRIGDLADKDLSDVIGKDMADKVIEGEAKKYEGDGLRIGGKGMIGFYGSPKDNSLGILGDLAKSLYKQTPEKLTLDNYREQKLKELQKELDEHTANKTANFKARDFHLYQAENETDIEEKEYALSQADLYQKEGMESAAFEESVLKDIKRLGVEYQYSINITPELKAQVEVGLPLFMANPSGADILGFSFANRMYLNGEKLNPNTIIHEAGHIWVEWARTNAAEIYAKGMELVEKSPYLQKAKNSKFYQEQAAKLGTEQEKEEYFKHEALAMAIGDKGAQFVVESKKDAFKDWLKTLWNKIKSLTGFKDLTEEQFQNLTFEEFSKMAVKEILGVENDLDKFQAVRSMKKKKDFVKNKVRGEANKRAIDDFEVDDMVKLIKADYDLQTLKNIRDAIQKRSAEEVLPSQPRKTRETRGERKRVEPRVEGDEATGEGEDAQPEGIEKDWEGAITIAANEERRQMLGLPEYQRQKQSFEEWANKAIKMIKKGYNVEKLLDKMEKNNYVPTPEENQIRKIYVAKLKSDYDKNPSAELEKKLIRYTEINDIVNSAAGRQLRSLADVTDPRETLADYVIAKMEANGVDELTDKQRKEVEKQYKEVKKKEEEKAAKFEINEELNTQLLAEGEIQEVKKARKPYEKSRDYKAERKSVIEEIKRKWKEKGKPTDVLLAVPLPFSPTKAKQLYAIAPDVSKLMTLYVEEGVDNLKEITSRIYVDLRNEIDGLEEKDIQDVIAGRYKRQKPLLNQIQLKKAELKKEADLIAQIEDVMAGKMPTNEKAKIEQNQKLTNLRNQLRDIKKEFNYYDLSKLNSLKERNLKEIEELDEKIKNGNFEKQIKAPSFLENPQFKNKYPKEYDSYLTTAKELSDKKHEFEVLLAKDEVSKMNIREKITKKWWPEFKSTLEGIKATADNSFIFIQLGPAIWQNPSLLPKVLNEQRKVIFNEGRFRKQMLSIYEDKEFANLIKVSGLDILDPQSLREKLREEQLGGVDFLERGIDIKGKKYKLSTLVKAPFERIAVTAGNYVRIRLFLEEVAHLQAQGKTIETHEKEYKEAARIANELTARGEMSEEFQTGIFKTLAAFTWAPKMLASTLNLLGLGDIYNYALGRKGYYASLSPELRKTAIAKMATAITVPYLIMAAIALDDDFEVDYDPRSVTFGQLKQISTGDSWNPYGRFTSVVRYLLLMMLGVRYINDEQSRADFKTETFKFFRGKMSPAYGLSLDLIFRETFDGQPLSFEEIAKDAVTPLALKDLKTYLQDDGTLGLITKGLPAISGIKVGTEKQFNQAKQPLEDIIKKHARTDDTYYSFELKNPTTKEIATKEQFEKFVKERDRLIAEKLTDLYNGYVITDSPNPVPFVSLEANEASKKISTAKTESTKEAKEIVFGKKKKTVMERLIERKRRMLRR